MWEKIEVVKRYVLQAFFVGGVAIVTGWAILYIDCIPLPCSIRKSEQHKASSKPDK